MQTAKEIMATISCNGMREWTDERVEQAMTEYARQEVKKMIRKREKLGNFLSIAYLIVMSVMIVMYFVHFLLTK